MLNIMDKVLAVGMLVTAIITLWAVVTPNHLYIG